MQRERCRIDRQCGERPNDPDLAQCGPFEGFDAKLRSSDVMAELRRVRNIKPGFKKGMWFGLLNAVWETVTFGLSQKEGALQAELVLRLSAP